VLGLVVGLATVPLVLVGGLAVLAWARLPSEIPPEGPGCSFEIDSGSGPSSSFGVERIDWGVIPQRVCVATLRSGEIRTYPDLRTAGDLVSLVVGLGAACLVGTGVAVRVGRPRVLTPAA